MKRTKEPLFNHGYIFYVKNSPSIIFIDNKCLSQILLYLLYHINVCKNSINSHKRVLIHYGYVLCDIYQKNCLMVYRLQNIKSAH